MRRLVAGHEFPDDSVDSYCTKTKHNGEPCLASRSFLFQATPDDVGKVGYAHSMHLSLSEYNEITQARTVYEEHCEKVMSYVRMVSG